jgi:hypothetical protein
MFVNERPLTFFRKQKDYLLYFSARTFRSFYLCMHVDTYDLKYCFGCFHISLFTLFLFKRGALVSPPWWLMLCMLAGDQYRINHYGKNVRTGPGLFNMATRTTFYRI